MQVHKLEVALNWHLTQGALQDASVLQLLANTAAADGNVIVLGLVLPLFERMGWLVSMTAAHGLLVTLLVKVACCSLCPLLRLTSR